MNLEKIIEYTEKEIERKQANKEDVEDLIFAYLELLRINTEENKPKYKCTEGYNLEIENDHIPRID